MAERITDNENFSYERTFQDLKSKVACFKKISRIISMMKSRKDTSL
ncbi:hypothetical protein Clocl_3182 [Acetivibrio clariflavus DSM 19732]|jgi:hypothetical protein|uniref:Uncharacterized protein n=1 Tax=Acetivibrio clariflavus (strain DSM 19732 / NBRC 101661 / EBR45) TaxID=720554 RepID=G8LVR8_ACECE|nr:hypothetical protein Clocl_3182 [Acetivibrio clariflavus DSM 19732]